MSELPGRLDLEALLARREWVHRLARGLVRDAADAQDLAQDVLVRALRHGESSEGWLRTVLVHRWRELARRRARRAEREERAARPEGQPAADAIAERVELERRLAEAVAALPEPGRTALVLRFHDGLRPREIAERLHLPVRTVESRLRRALEELRRTLDARHEGRREAWLGGVTGLALAGGARAELPFAPLAAAALALLALGLGVASLVRDAGTGEARDSSALVLLAPPPRAMEADARTIAEDPRSARARLPDQRAALAPRLELRLVRAHDSAPLAGARCTLRIAGADGRSSTLERRADASGRIELPWSGARGIEVELEPTPTTRAAWGRFREPGEHVVAAERRGGTLSGTIIDALGAPVSAAEVLLWRESPHEHSYSWEQPLRSARSDAQGRWRLEDLAGPAGEHMGFALAARSASARSLEHVVGRARADREREGIELVVFPARTLAGLVLDADGSPVAGATITAWTAAEASLAPRGASIAPRLPAGLVRLAPVASPTTLLSDARGRFTLLRTLEPWWLRVTHPAQASWSGEATDEDSLVIRLSRGASVAGRVLDETGRPLEGVEVSLVLARERRPPVHSDARGRFELVGLSELAGAALGFRAAGFAMHVARVDLDDELPARLEARLEAERVLAGHVLDASGSPRAGAYVELRGERSTPNPFSPEQPSMRWESLLGQTGTTTDAEGAFRFEQLYAGRFRLRVSAHAQAGTSLAYLEADAGTEELVIREGEGLDRSASVRGRVSLEGEGAYAGTISVQATPLGPGSGRARLDELRFVVCKGPDFLLDGLEPGRWRLEIGASFLPSGSNGFAVDPAGSTVRELELLRGENPLAIELRGHAPASPR